MLKDPNILLFIRLLPFRGEEVLGRRWLDFAAVLRARLRQHGMEEKDGNPDFVRFRFMRPHSALAAAAGAVEAARKATGWPRDTPAPLQVVIDLPQEGEPGPEFIVSGPDAALLVPERPHITRRLKHEWLRLTAGDELAAAEFEPAGNELFTVRLPERVSLAPRPLFRGRAALLEGKGPACFYCAARSHRTGQCPSRLLGMEHRGAPLLGRLSPGKIDKVCTGLLTSPGGPGSVITPTLDPARIRKDVRLQAACALFDTGLVFQPRFLRNLVFSIDPEWARTFSTRRQNIDDPMLNLAFDSLRSGNHAEAREQFEAAAGSRRKSSHYGAACGLALLALETGEDRQALAWLIRARDSALHEKEAVHARLMLSRHHLLKGDLLKAADELGGLNRAERNHRAVRYAAVQVAAGRGDAGFLDELARLLRTGDGEEFVHALLDPLLAPVSGLVEELLTARLEEARAAALRARETGRKEMEELALWTGEDDDEWRENHRVEETVDRLLASGGYLALLDAAARAASLVPACLRVREKRREELKRTWAAAEAVCRRCAAFWGGFAYAGMFRDFGARLAATAAKARRTGERLEGGMNGKEYRRLVEQVGELQEETGKLLRDLERIQTIGGLLDMARAFGRYLLVSEAVAIALAAAGVALVSESGWAVAALLHDPLVQRRIVYLAVFLAAPVLSLILAAVKRG